MLGSTSRIMQLARFIPAQHILLCVQQSRSHTTRIVGGNATPSRTWGLDYRSGWLRQENAKRRSCSAAYRHDFPSPTLVLAQAIAKVAIELYEEEDGKENVRIPVAQEAIELKVNTGEIEIDVESSATAITREELMALLLPSPFEDMVECDTTSRSKGAQLHFRSDCPIPAMDIEHTTNLPGGLSERSDDEPTAPSGFEPSVLLTAPETPPTNSTSTNAPSMGILNGVENVSVTSCNFYQAAGDQYIISVTSSSVDHDRSFGSICHSDFFF